MSLPGRPRTYDGILNDLIARVRVLEALPDGAPVPGVWIPATIQSGWSNTGSPYYNAAYRLGLDGDSLEIRGNVTPDDELSSGTVVFYLGSDYTPTSDVSYVTDIVYGTGFTVARVLIDSTDGGVYMSFPCECGTVIGS